MWKPLFALLVSLAVISSAMFLYRNRHQLFRPDLERIGGTLLVYEVEGQAPSEQLSQAVQVLQQRFDPNGSLGMVVRLTEKGEVEIGIPTGNKHLDQLEQVKRLISRQGKVEFHLLATSLEDAQAFRVAQEMLQTPEARLQIPPPAPRNKEGQPRLPVLTAEEQEAAYHWVRLSSYNEKLLRLDPPSLRHDNPVDHQSITQALRTGAPFSPSLATELLMAARRQPRETDPTFFVLTRQPSKDQELTGAMIERVSIVDDSLHGGHPVVSFRLKLEATRQLASMRGQHGPSTHHASQIGRLGILLDGELLAMPHLYQVRGRELTIPGDFTRQEAEDLAILIRGGALPLRFKPDPVREVTLKGK